MSYCERDLCGLAQSEPSRLISLVSSDQLDAVELMWAGEALGDVTEGMAVPVLLSLLKHEREIVRAGALLGLSHHREYAGVADAIRFHAVAANEPSAAVREIAGDIIEYIETYGV